MQYVYSENSIGKVVFYTLRAILKLIKPALWYLASKNR